MNLFKDILPQPKRRSHKFLDWFVRSISAILAVIFLGLIYVFQIEPNWYDLHQVTITLPHLPVAFDRYKIVQLTDLHIDNVKDVDRLQKIVQLTTAQQPDLVLLTGDYITGAIFADKVEKNELTSPVDPYDTIPQKILRVITSITNIGNDQLPTEQYLPTLAAGLQNLRAPDGVLAVLGNHDRWNWNAPQFMKVFQDLGIKFLENDLTKIYRGKEQLQIAGVRDVFFKEADLQPILAQLSDSQAAILLAHEPDFADTSSVTGKFGLQLSGHSHGGQVYLPGLKRITPPLGEKYPAGQYLVNQMIQYTSRGVGIITPKVRFNCRPEITIITLRSPILEP